MSHDTQLKRSQKIDFTSQSHHQQQQQQQTPLLAVTRERSFVRPNKRIPNKSYTVSIPNQKNKPTMEIYRPPNVRSDLPVKLNVHAKEFTMNQLQSSKSSLNLNLAMGYEHNLQHSKSSGNILRYNHTGLIPIMPLPLLHSASSTQLLNQLQRPVYHPELITHPVFTGLNQIYSNSSNSNNWINHKISPKMNNLKRSKSLGAADANSNNNNNNKLTTKLKDIHKEDIDINIFNESDQSAIKSALDDPSQLPTRTLMDLVKVILEKVVEGIKYSETISKLCITIIENEKNQTFLETLLNTCQQWYQERDKILRGIKSGDGTRFTAFMWFLTEMCCQLKRHNHHQFESTQLQPEITLLSILAKCCQACVELPIKCLSETECLFFVLTSIGRDLETELPQQLEVLLASVRDGFLASAGSSGVRRTLLQLIELHASNWQLPGSSVLYYYPRIK